MTTRAPGDSGPVREEVIDALLDLARERERDVFDTVGSLDTKLAVVLASLGALFTVGGSVHWFDSAALRVLGVAWCSCGISACLFALRGLSPRNYKNIPTKVLREKYAAEGIVEFKDRLLSTYNENLLVNLACNRAKAQSLRRGLWLALAFVVLMVVGGGISKYSGSGRGSAAAPPADDKSSADEASKGPEDE